MVTFFYQIKLEGTHNKHLLAISKTNVLSEQTTSQNVETKTEWRLLPETFRKITKAVGDLKIDMFVLRSCHQLPQYMACKPNANRIAPNTYSRTGSHNYVFRIFCTKNQLLH